MAANQAQSEGNPAGMFLAICLNCFLGCIEGLVEYLNHYAYTQVAIYGKPYLTAARDTWTLIKTRGVDAIINDNLIGNVLLMGGLLIGAAVSGISYGFFAASSIPKNDFSYPLVICILGFVIGLAEFTILSEVIESGTATTFVCLAEEPGVLLRTKPQLFAKIQQTYPSLGF